MALTDRTPQARPTTVAARLATGYNGVFSREVAACDLPVGFADQFVAGD